MANWKHTSPKQLVRSHLNRGENTRRAYAADLRALADFLKVKTMTEAAQKLIHSEQGAAKRILEDWKNFNRAQSQSLATTRRRISSILALLAMAQEFGVIPWGIRFRLPAATTCRDTTGPGRDAIERMMTVCQQRADDKGKRDLAIVCLLFYSAMRAEEVLSLDLAHVDLLRGELRVATKGHWDRERLPVPMKTRETLERWIAARGDWPGALFVTMGKGCRQRERLTYDGLYAVVRELGRKVGVQCHPHGFRHTAASEIARLTHGNVKWGMALTRHADPKTFMAYDDTRAKNMRQASELLVRGAYFRTEPQATDN